MAEFKEFLNEIHKLKYGVVAFNTYTHKEDETILLFYLMVAKKGITGTFHKIEGNVGIMNYVLDKFLDKIKKEEA